jgi:hypothetical protein
MPHETMHSRALTGLLPAAAAALALALLSSGCGSSGVTLDPVAQAAEATSSVGGAHVTLSAKVSAPGSSSPFTMSGEGFFNYKAQEGTLTLDMSGIPGVGAASLAGGLHMQEVFKSSTIYVSSPLFAGKLPGGARWIKLSLARVGQSLGFNLQQLAGGQSNPAQFLQYLRASAGKVTRVGHETVRGVATTHYTGTVDLRKVADVMPSSGRAQLRAALDKVIAQTGVATLPVGAWVDAHGLVRRMTLMLSLPVAGQRLQMEITVDLFGFGPTPTVTPPPEREVFDATQSALAGLGSGSG